MANVVLLVFVVFLPTLLGFAVIGIGRLVKRIGAREHRLVPVVPPIERIAADLRRLNLERRQLLGQERAPGRGVRCRAVTAAYLDVLGTACGVLDVAPPRAEASGRTPTTEIARVESELRHRGLDVEPQRAG